MKPAPSKANLERARIWLNETFGYRFDTHQQATQMISLAAEFERRSVELAVIREQFKAIARAIDDQDPVMARDLAHSGNYMAEHPGVPPPERCECGKALVWPQPEAYPGQWYFHEHNANIRESEKRYDARRTLEPEKPIEYSHEVRDAEKKP